MINFRQINFKRIITFQLVAWLGTAINITVLWLLKGVLDVPLLIAGACAIEIAIVHNFTWHYFVTWKGRVSGGLRDYFIRLFHYNIVTASIDFVVNLGTLWVLTTFFGIHYLIADLLGKLAGPLFKYFANEFVIFRHKSSVTEKMTVGKPDGKSRKS